MPVLEESIEKNTKIFAMQLEPRFRYVNIMAIRLLFKFTESQAEVLLLMKFDLREHSASRRLQSKAIMYGIAFSFS